MRIAATAFFLVLSIPALAQTSSVPKADKLNTLTVDQVVQIAQGLSQLDCASKIIKDGAKETVACEPYKWSPGMVWQIATAQRKARDVVNDFQRLKDVEITKLPRKADGSIADEVQSQFSVKMRGLLDQDAKVVFDKFKRDQLEPMNLPPSVISLLLPIIE